MERKQVVEDSDQFYNIRLLLGNESFKKVEDVLVAFVGTGTLGSNLAVSLAGNGFKKFVFIDGDRVDERNIPLCDAFSLKDVGRYKVLVLKDFLRAKYGESIQIETHPVYVHKVPHEVLTEPSMLVLGVDNNATKLFVTYTRMQSDKPMITLGFWGWEASYMLTLRGKTACWACLYRPDNREEAKRMKEARRCPEPEPNIPGAVVHGTVSIVSGIVSNEVLKFFLKKGRIVQYYAFDVLTGNESIRFLDENCLKPDPDCPICQRGGGLDVSRFGRNQNV
jgi:adenylyltransferase/sulfurtransferase